MQPAERRLELRKCETVLFSQPLQRKQRQIYRLDPFSPSVWRSPANPSIRLPRARLRPAAGGGARARAPAAGAFDRARR